MLVLNMGIPRSGSTWAYNVLRQILDGKQLPYDTANPLNPAEVDKDIASADPERIKIIHMHDVTPAVVARARQPKCAVFFNIRDPRDVVVSLMKLHDAEFSEAVVMAQSSYVSLQHASGIPGLMLIPYDHLRQHPEALIYQMALRIGHFIPLNVAAEIAESTSVARHRATMDHVASAESIVDENIGSVFSGRRQIRFDEASLITDRHIQSGKTGRWKDELDTDQQEELNRVFESIITQLGF